MMVSRYTIDQILACTNTVSHPTSRSTSISPPSSITPSSLTASSNTSFMPVVPANSKVIPGFEEDDEMREVTKSSIGSLYTSSDRVSSLPGNSENCQDSEDGESAITAATTASAFDPTKPIVARPVPIRPNQRPNGQSIQRLNGPTKERPPSLANIHNDSTPEEPPHSELGYNMMMRGLSVENSIYGIMLRQYMEAQLHGLTTTRPFLPLNYPFLDSAMPHLVGSGSMPFSLTSRSRRRGGQVRFSAEQTKQLEAWFRLHKYITPPQRKTIAEKLNLHERQVKTWFQNRRAKWRKSEGQNGIESMSPETPQPLSASPDESGDGHFEYDLHDDLSENDQSYQEDLIVDDQPEGDDGQDAISISHTAHFGSNINDNDVNETDFRNKQRSNH